MKFIKQGKAYQLVIENGHDLKDALTLDEALWVAMSAPAKAFVCDPKFLEYVNTGKNGHLSSEEVKAAIKWLLDVYPKKDQITGPDGNPVTVDDLYRASELGISTLEDLCAIRTRCGSLEQFLQINALTEQKGNTHE